MAQFLNTQGVSHFLDKLIDNATDKLYLISPYLQLNRQLKINLEDKAKFRIDIVMIYGKVADLNPEDSEWLKNQNDIKLLFHKDLHAKCYINEKEAIVTSMNLHMYSQQNNIEMGIYISKEKDSELYDEIFKEAEKIKRGSEHRKISIQKVESESPSTMAFVNEPIERIEKPLFNGKFLSTTALSKEIGCSSKDLFAELEYNRFIERKNNEWVLTKTGKNTGAQVKKGQYGEYIAWPETMLKFLFVK